MCLGSGVTSTATVQERSVFLQTKLAILHFRARNSKGSQLVAVMRTPKARYTSHNSPGEEEKEKREWTRPWKAVSRP